MKRYLVPLTLLFALAISAPASAKEIASAKVCGPSGCHTETDRQKLAGFEGGGSDAQPPKSGSAFYTVTLTIKAENATDKFTIAYLPSQGLIRSKQADGSQAWVKIDEKEVTLYDRLAKGLTAFPAAQLGKIAPAPVARVQSTLSAPVTPPDDGGFPWLIVLMSACGVVLLATVLTGRRRVRARRASSPAPTAAS